MYKKRKMSPLTDEHKNNLRLSNLKAWSNPELLKRQSEKAKKRMQNMDEHKRSMWLLKLTESLRSDDRREKARKVMLKNLQNPEFIRKRNEAISKLDRTGSNNSFYNKKHTVETRYKISKTKKDSPFTPRGADNPAYIDGLGTKRKYDRINFHETLEYRIFRESVFKRDNYKCVLCGNNKKLQIDHIKAYSTHPELRTNLDNGRVLCHACHVKTPNYGRKKQ